jgi:ADYC domain-containing protein
MQARRSRVARVAMAVSTLGALGACAAGPGPQVAEIEAPITGPCPSVVCGMNSPEVDNAGFHDLSLLGAANDAGFRIETSAGVAQIVVDQKWYDLQAHGNHVTAVNGGTVLSGSQLNGARIPLVRNGAHYVIRIDGVRELPFFVGDPELVGAYQLSWSTGAVTTTEQFHDLCNNIKDLDGLIADQGGVDTDYARNELMGMTTLEAVMFEGDRIFTSSLTVDDKAQDEWVSFGCAGHTLSKLLLTRNTVHSQPAQLAGYERRQATLKMLSADYCGDGTAFTVSGQILAWKGDRGEMTFHPAEPRELEARWDHNGATCIGAPRMLHPTSQRGANQFPDIVDLIARQCRKPACRDLDPANLGKAYRVSANP